MINQDVDRIKAAHTQLVHGATLLHRCGHCLRQRPSAIVTDIDGTISEIASTPDLATVTSRARAVLGQLVTRLDLVGVVTGRAAEDAERLVGLPSLLYIGNHGLERRVGGRSEIHAGAHAAIADVASALAEIRREMEDEGVSAGLIYENKRLSASIHYRLAGDPAEAGRRLRAHALAIARRASLNVTEGRFVIELRPQLTVNKGTAMEEIVADHALRGVIFLGDDLTDIDAFRVVRRLTAAGEIDGCAVAVASPEVHSSVMNEADGVVVGVEHAVDLLAKLANDLNRTAATNTPRGR